MRYLGECINMTGWNIMICGVVSGSGVLAFMTLVANEIELATIHLHLMEAAERKALKKRKEAQEVFDADVVEVAEKAT